MKLRLLIAAALLPTLMAATPREDFQNGNHEEAAAALEKQLAEKPSAEGYVNVALAFEKADKPALAILNYERALLLDPGMDVAKNRLAELAAEHRVNLPPHEWTDTVVAIAHPDTLVGAGAVLGWFCAFAILFLILGSGRPRWLWPVAVIGLFVGFGLFSLGWISDPRMADASLAVVTSSESADVLTQPATNSDKLADLPPGSPVGVLSPRGAWTYVDLAGGARGWMQTDQLTPVVPGETL